MNVDIKFISYTKFIKKEKNSLKANVLFFSEEVLQADRAWIIIEGWGITEIWGWSILSVSKTPHTSSGVFSSSLNSARLTVDNITISLLYLQCRWYFPYYQQCWSWYEVTAWKVSKYWVISGPYLETFHAVSDATFSIFLDLSWRRTVLFSCVPWS